MTREETIKWLESLKDEIGKTEHRTLWHYAEAVDMAIEALKAQYTAEKLTQDLADKLNDAYNIGYNAAKREIALSGEYERAYQRGKADATKWSPVSERLPKEEKKTYWVCTDTECQCECRWTNNRFGIGDGEWGWSIFDTPQYTKPVAWMPLPEPYREDGEAWGD